MTARGFFFSEDLVHPREVGSQFVGCQQLVRLFRQTSFRCRWKWCGSLRGAIVCRKRRTAADTRRLRTDFARMYQIFREENPRAVISNYGMPSEHLHGIRHYRPNVDNEAILANGGKSANAVRPPPLSATMPILCSTSLPPIWCNGKKT